MISSGAYFGYFNENGNLQGIVQIIDGQAVIVGRLKVKLERGKPNYILRNAKTGEKLHWVNKMQARKVKGLKMLTEKMMDQYFD